MTEVVSATDEERLCRNCGAEARHRFCPACGQNTNVGLPTFRELLADTLGAVFSYDTKVWRTVGSLVRHPGALTVDYLAGRRARYLSPFQTFFWLETLAFLANRSFFSNGTTIEAKSRALILVGVCIASGLSLLYARRGIPFVAHLIAAVHVWAFLMLWLLVEYVVVPATVRLLEAASLVHGSVSEGLFITLSTQIATAAYLVVALRRVYGVGWLAALAQTAFLYAIYTVAAFGLNRATGAGV